MTEFNEQISVLISNKLSQEHAENVELIKALRVITSQRYNFSSTTKSKKTLNNEEFQRLLSRINEKSSKRKENGVYYTPDDVSNFIIENTVLCCLNVDYPEIKEKIKFESLLKQIDSEIIKKFLFKTKKLDPTCGTGDFLINLLKLKIKILNEKGILNDDSIKRTINTIYGNDINSESTDVAKIRLLFYIAPIIKNKSKYIEIAKLLNSNFTNYDFVSNHKKFKDNFDIIIGNPPYVEYSKYSNQAMLKNNYGNIYADIIKNSLDLLKKNGTLGFIVPLSYVATTRMKNIRQYVADNCKSEIIFNFADRPDCLFESVHQKLSIIILKKDIGASHEIYTSNYNFWYQNERRELFKKQKFIICNSSEDDFIPKIGNITEKNIFKKIFTNQDDNLYELQDCNGKEIFINMRLCFWMKAFHLNPGSKEYKSFKYINSNYILCLLNSSLFWLYWVIISDCWHLTLKEMKHFKVKEKITKSQQKTFDKLYSKLSDKLERTKKYVGTKQIEYEYKHRQCKDIINDIDRELAKIYNISEKELRYIQEFALKYRMGDKDGN